MNQLRIEIYEAVQDFIKWLYAYGETSYDHQSYFAGPIGGRAKAVYYKNKKLGMIAVAPMIFSEAFFPKGRMLYWKKQRFPIADAHYAMGFALLAKITQKEEYYQKAVHFLDVLTETRSPGYEHYCWGYPFDWVTQYGTIPAHTPFITTLPYVYEAFEYVYEMDKNEKWLQIMKSIAEHAHNDIRDYEISPEVYSCSYSPVDTDAGVVNASAYRAFLLTAAGQQFSDKSYLKSAQGNMNFVFATQNHDGSWYYSNDNKRTFVDHFHTCFVLKALTKIDALTDNDKCRERIKNGIAYYTENLFDVKGCPKPFSKAPRITVYQNELYDYAESINLGSLLLGNFKALDERLSYVLSDLLKRWRKADGSFYSRKLKIGWDNVPMHRWAQAQLFRSLCFYLYKTENDTQPLR